tara:strand:- start:2681 stop:4426 length:1746 start_codon:yes stop_codon:yes gene_type:complete
MPVSYNGYVFTAQASYNASIAAQYDERGITVIGQTMTLSVTDYIFPDCGSVGYPIFNNNASNVDKVYATLMTAQGKLDIPDDIGLGTTNDDAGVSDYYINGGPFPQSCEIKNMGGGLATEIRWQVKFTFLPCWQMDSGALPIKALNWSKQYSVDDRGFTTVVTSGYLERPPEVSFSDGQATSKETGNADTEFTRNTIIKMFPELDNFHRDYNWNLSTNHARLNFSITDKEIQSPNAYPKDVVSISFPTSVKFAWPLATKSKADINIRMTVMLAQNAPRVVAWQIWATLVRLRLQTWRAEPNSSLITTSMDLTEDWFNNTYSFSMTATLHENIYRAMSGLGIFRHIGSKWSTWADSLQGVGKVRSPVGSGFARLIADDGTENYENINMCNQPGESAEDKHYATFPAGGYESVLCDEIPTPTGSWINSDVDLVESTVYESQVATSYDDVEIEGETVSTTEPTSGNSNGNLIKGDYETCIQEAPPTLKGIWMGYTQRVHYKIPPLNSKEVIESLVGQKVTLVGEGKWRTKRLGVMQCLAIYEAEWYQEFVVIDQVEAPDSDYIDPIPTSQPDWQDQLPDEEMGS